MNQQTKFINTIFVKISTMLSEFFSFDGYQHLGKLEHNQISIAEICYSLSNLVEQKLYAMYKSLEYFYDDCEILHGSEHNYPNVDSRITSTIPNFSNTVENTRYFSRIKVRKLIEGVEHVFISELILHSKENIKFAFLQDKKFLIWYDENNLSNYYFDSF